MKITKRQLKRIIREEAARLQEAPWVDRWTSDTDYPNASIEVDWLGDLAALAELADIGLSSTVVDGRWFPDRPGHRSAQHAQGVVRAGVLRW